MKLVETSGKGEPVLDFEHSESMKGKGASSDGARRSAGNPTLGQSHLQKIKESLSSMKRKL